MTQVPKGWVEVNLEDTLAPLKDGRIVHQGWSPQCEKQPSDNDDTWGVLKTTSIQSGAFLPEHNKRLPDTLKPRPLLEVQKGDVLITCAGPRARCGIACLVRDTRPRLMLSGKMYRFRFDNRLVDPRFGEAYLLSQTAVRAIDRMKTGISDSGLNLTHGRFRKLRFPLAPLAEQRRIVDALEEQFSRLDAAENSLSRAREKSGGLRRSLVRRALRKGLFEEQPLTDVVEVLDARRIPVNAKERAKRPGDVPYYGATGQVGWIDKPLFNEELVLLGEDGAPFLDATKPKAYVIDGPSWVNNHAHVLRAISGAGLGWYVKFALDCVDYHPLATGTTRLKLTQAAMRRIQIPLPDIPTQQRIVQDLQQQVSIAEAVDIEVQVAQRRSEAMRISVLADAFAGRLAAHNRDGRPEPAALAGTPPDE